MQQQTNIQNQQQDSEFLSIIKFLQENNLELNKVSQNSNTFLIEAIKHNCFDACQFLIQQNQILDYKNNDGFTPIIQAANDGRYEICRLLLEQQNNIQQNDINYAMIFAIKNKHLQVFQYLRSKNGNINVCNYDFQTFNNVLIAAYFSYDISIFKYIVNDTYIDLNLRNSSGQTILIFACIENNFDVVKILLDKNIDLNSQDNQGKSALMYVCEKSIFPICDLLLKQSSVNINIQDSFGNSALFYACQSKNIQIFNLLLKHKKIDVSILNNIGQHVLYICLQHQQFNFFKLLVKTHKIQLDSYFWYYDDYRQAIFYYLVKYADSDLISFFIQRLSRYSKSQVITNLTQLFLDLLKYGNIDTCIQLLNKFSLQFNQLQISHFQKTNFISGYENNIQRKPIVGSRVSKFYYKQPNKNHGQEPWSKSVNTLNQQTQILQSTLKQQTQNNAQSTSKQQKQQINTITDQQIQDFHLSSKELSFLQNTNQQNFDQICKFLQNKKFQQYQNIPLRFQILQSKIPIRNKFLYQDIIINNSSNDIKEYIYYIKQVLQIPFDKYVDDIVNCKHNNNQQIQEFIMNFAKQLDLQIYGQQNAKNLLLELVCKRISSNSQQGNIIGLQGPPGCGKTSLVKNGLAKNLNRPVEFIPMAQVTDHSFLNGNNRQWKGAHFGKILQTLIKYQCMNPIFVFDEIDKISNTTQGLDVQNILSSILDFSQNNQFQDQYFDDLYIDLSKSIFIVTYNDETLLSPILLNRINSIRIDGYNLSEKIIITSQYIIPKIIKQYNFEVDYITFDNDVIEYLINNFVEQEPGIRKTEAAIDKIFSKLNIERFTSQSIFQISILNNQQFCKITIENINKLFQDSSRQKSL